MQRQVVKTGQYGIGLQIHTVHVGADASELTRFYRNVFGAQTYIGADEPGYSPREDRYATLSVISDFCIEVMAPKQPVDPQRPIGKFFTKFGQHLHSVGYAVDDLVGLGNHLIRNGVRIGKPGGGYLQEMDPQTDYVFPNPRDTDGLMIELCGVDIPGDPRVMDTWSARSGWWEDEQPLGIRRLAYQTLGVRDLDAAAARYAQLFDVTTVAEGYSAEERARYRIVHLGDGLLRLAQPDADGTALAAHVHRYGDMIYSVTFRVTELGAVEQWLAKNDIRTTRLGDSLLVAEPDDTFGAAYTFTTSDVPDDPFA